jgi:hypothetical protein
LYPIRPSTSRQRNGYDCGVFSILFALHTGLSLNMNNINQARFPTVRCQMLLHILKKAQANDNNEVLPVSPDRQEANTNNPLVLLSGPEEDSDKRSAHIDGISDVDGGDDGNYVGETVDAAYDVDDGEEDDASQANDNTDAGQDDGGNNNEVDGGRGQENAGEDNNNKGVEGNAGHNEEDGGQENDPAYDHGDAVGGGDQEEDDLGDNADDSNDEKVYEEEEVDSEEDDENVDALYQEAKDMEPMAESQPTFGGLPGALPPSQVYSDLVADMSRPALMVLTPPSAALAIQDDELTLPATSPVIASLSPFLSEDVSRSIEK